MQKQEVMDMHINIVREYATMMYTYGELANKMGVKENVVAFCVPKAGYRHGKAKQGVRGVYYENEPMFCKLQALLEKE